MTIAERPRRAVARWWWGAGLIALTTAVAASPATGDRTLPGPSPQVTCDAAPVYAGPPRRSAPAGIWQRDFTRSIDGALPPALQARLDAAVTPMLARVPALSVAVAIPGVGRWAATRGLAQREPPIPVIESQPFQAASTTKTFTAAVVMQIVGDGRLRLDDPVARWFPDVPHAARMTVDDLLRHTNGLVSFNALPTLGAAYRTPADVIALSAAQRPLFCPGTNWNYTNTGYAMLGAIVEQIEGRPLADVLDVRLLEPLGLRNTTLRRAGVAWPVVSGHASGESATVDDGYATPHAAGSLASTAADLVTFWHALLGGRVIEPPMVRALFADMTQMGPDGQSFYGRGVQFYDAPNGPGLMLGHSGGITGFTSVVAWVAADDLFVSVIFNDKDVPAEAGLWALVRAVREARTGGGTGAAAGIVKDAARQ